MTFYILTIFPDSLKSYFNTSILARAQKDKLMSVKFINIRDFTKDKHKTTDDKPYGGGAGMVFKIEPIVRAIDSIISNQISKSKFKKTKIILLTPSGKQFTQKMAQDFSKKYSDIVLICGRYEGVDARLKKVIRNLKLVISNLSVGPYILTGGELPAMVVVDAVSRHISGVLGKEESLEEKKGSYPVYTRPEVFEYHNKRYCTPKVLLSGDHKKINEWRQKHSN